MKKIILFIILAGAVQYLTAQNQLVQYQYWFDYDYANRVTQTISPQDSITVNSLISAADWEYGFHSFNFRCKDSQGNWSQVVNQFVEKPFPPGPEPLPTQIDQYEYWFDRDYANRVTQTVSPQDSITVNSLISGADWEDGFHTFNFRSRNTLGQWSPVINQFVEKPFPLAPPVDSNNKIKSYRYWYDNNDSLTYYVNLPRQTNPLFMLTQFNLMGIGEGRHAIHFQFQDSLKNWSCTTTDSISNLGYPKIEKIIPNFGGNLGTVTATITGAFINITSVKLTKSGQNDIIIPDSMYNIGDHGNKIIAGLNLLNKALGYWHLVISNPDTTMIMYNAFRIDSGIVAKPWVELVGFDRIHTGDWQTYTINYGNNGNLDALDPILWLAIPSNGVEIRLNFDLFRPDTLYPIYDSIHTNLVLNYDSIPIYFVVDTLFGEVKGYRIYPIEIFNIPPGTVGHIQFSIKSTIISQQIPLRTWITDPMYEENTGAKFNFPFTIKASLKQCIRNYIEEVTGDAIPCAMSLYLYYLEKKKRDFFDMDYNPNDVPSIGDLMLDMYLVIQNCGSMAVPFIKAVKEAIDIIEKGTQLAKDLNNQQLNIGCIEITPKPQDINDLNTIDVQAWDPNDKAGPSNNSSGHYIPDDMNMGYLIRFENDSAATAAAQIVTVIDSLDMDVYDLSTLRLGIMTVGERMIETPENLREYHTLLDLRPYGNDVIADVNVTMNNATGVLRWDFITLDPITMDTTIIPTAGFLPPNINQPEGEGSMFFSINLKDSTLLGTQIRNKAYIYFDNNAAIVTPTWQNIVDNVNPVSSVTPLPTYTRGDTVHLSWHGSDAGSGIEYYAVYYSRNNGDYRLLYTKNDTSGIFVGQLDSTYRFYSIAIDSACNAEAAPLMYDAITTIALPYGIYSVSSGLPGFKMYPNPAKTTINIEFQPADVPKNSFIMVFNLQGRLISQQALSEAKTEVNISGLSKGLYFIKVGSTEGSEVRKFAKE